MRGITILPATFAAIFIPDYYAKKKYDATGKRLATSFAVFVAMFIPMNVLVGDWMAEKETTLMDFIIGGYYDVQQVQAILDTIDVQGRTFYRHMLALDCLMGILYTLFFVSFIALALKKCPRVGDKWNFLILIPLLGMLSDWTENLMTLCNINSYPDISTTAVAVSSVATTLKYSFLGLAFVIGIVFYIVGYIRRRKNIKF